ncbi:50S ribosomal protein L33 [Mycoplasma amphoriforme]|uniref:50S ribosomal protein L33 n=1 Tax=Mycoplasma amphoriforme TaxID=273136 RepID=UPI0031BA1789
MAVKRGTRLSCKDCSEINYITHKNSKKNPEKLELNKYCSRCKKATVHKEIKKK